MAKPEYSVYPQVFGIEEELQIEGRCPGGSWQTVEGDHLQDALDAYQDAAATDDPPIIYTQPYGPIKRRGFNSVGDKTYIDCANAERSIAECSNIREAIMRSRGVERFAGHLARHLLELNPGLEEVVHRRRAGVFDDIVGTQDSVQLATPPGADPVAHAAKVENMLSAFALVRPFMTGVGHYENGQFHFSQKLSGLSNYWAGSKVELRLAIKSGDRVEVRENDINLNDAMAAMRLGESAIAAAVAQTPLIKEFEDFIEEAMRGHRQWNWSDRFNVPALNPDGTFDTKYNNHILWAADQHLELADAFNSSKMSRYAGEQPSELLDIADKIYNYALLMKRVLRNHAPIQDLVHLSEWAVKQTQGSERGPLDYDNTFYSLDTDGQLVINQTGLGFQLRDSGAFEGTIPAHEVDAAYSTPPVDTRAAVRAAIIGSYRTWYAGWNTLAIFRRTRFGTVHPAYIRFDDPRLASLTEHQKKVLRHAVQLDETSTSTGFEAPDAGGQRPPSGDDVTEAIYRVIDATNP